MRAVLDTNVLISGLVFGGKPLPVMELIFSGGCEQVVSEPALKELERKLSTKFGWRSPAIALALEAIRDRAVIVSPSEAVTECIDPKDNMFLEAAVEGRADCIVSGDKHLLRMKRFRGIDIWTVDEFLRRMGRENPVRP
jgi:putative PIN family toxin of toxin-antitoxin system